MLNLLIQLGLLPLLDQCGELHHREWFRRGISQWEMPVALSKVDLGRIASSYLDPNDDHLNIPVISESQQMLIVHGHKLNLYLRGDTMYISILDRTINLFEHIRLVLF